MTLIERLLQFGIRLDNYAPGNRKLLCPQCSLTRRTKTDPCLSVTVDADAQHAVWNCHNCGWKGTTHGANAPPRQGRRNQPPKRPTRMPGLVTPRRAALVRRPGYLRGRGPTQQDRRGAPLDTGAQG